MVPIGISADVRAQLSRAQQLKEGAWHWGLPSCRPLRVAQG